MAVEATSGIAGSYAVQGSSAAAPVVNAPERTAAVQPVEAPEKAAQEFSITEGSKKEGGFSRDEEKNSGQASREALKDAVDKINKSVSNTSAIFGFHEKTNRITIKIVDKETKDVVKEIPAEETLDLVAKAWEMAGILVDEKR